MTGLLLIFANSRKMFDFNEVKSRLEKRAFYTSKGG